MSNLADMYVQWSQVWLICMSNGHRPEDMYSYVTNISCYSYLVSYCIVQNSGGVKLWQINNLLGKLRQIYNSLGMSNLADMYVQWSQA